MKIISKFKDYYDYMAYLGIDEKCVYYRQEHKLNSDDYPDWPWKKKTADGYYRRGPELHWLTFNTGLNAKEDQPSLYTGSVYFCGKKYLCWIYIEPQQVRWTGHWTVIDSERSYRIIWDIDEVLELVLKNTPKRKSYSKNWAKESYNHYKDKLVTKVDDSIFELFGCPIIASFSVEETNIYEGWPRRSYETYNVIYSHYANANLKERSFHNVVDAQKAWQELQMYLLGVLKVGEKDIVEVSNESKIKKGGFDLKTSFRRDNHKSKPRKNKKK